MDRVPKLEVIERGSAGEGPSLLFVHGLWQAAWTWDEYVMPTLAERGHHCVAVSLRGHGGSEGKIRGTSIDDYVCDVLSVVHEIGQTPIIIGHSMGGFTTQHYLAAGHPAEAVVLVSPVPASLAWGATAKAATRRPGKFIKTNLTLDVGAIVESKGAATDFLVGPNAPAGFIDNYYERLERASYRTFIDLLLKRPDLSNVDIPALVVGGSEDAFFTEKEWRRTAKQLGGDLQMIDGVGHQPMWEDEGSEVTELIHNFVR